ncbi:winged helix-turn-helix transcriptional regulator [Roseibium sediminis]|uniref:winged helix-turn-helix transcriptional regulator n=1 Tax=Roseibium sediminis TaxID=1775174 RepID=UPI00123C9342|nr:helix-turn-helix domain-containing protein [Roseibium sediminis]
MPKSAPKPGSPVRGSKSGKPIMALFDLLGRSWALGILWQLSDGPLTFRDLQARCESVSPTVLNKRLRELRDSLFVGRGDHGYELTPLGRDLFAKLHPLGNWSTKWAEQLACEPSNQEAQPE